MKQTDVIFVRGPLERRSELYCSQEQLKEFQFRNLDLIQLRFGSKRKAVRVILTPQHFKGRIVCTSDVFEELLLPESITIPIHIDAKKGTIVIGPVVGILANVRWKANTGLRGEQEKVFRKLQEAAHAEHAFAYVFSPLEVDWSKSSTWGYRYQKPSNQSNTRWERIKLPLPNTIYNQISTRKFERQKNVKDATKRLRNMIPGRYFNEGYFNKWQVHEWLGKDTATASYIPESARTMSETGITTLLNRYGNVYIKPIHGSLGIGIIKLSRIADGRIYYQIKQRASNIQGYAKTVSQALKTIQKGRNAVYMIQRGLSLMTYKNRPFDLRVLMQKDGDGNWSRTKMFARIAKQGDFTSNLSTGGDAKPVRVLLQEIVSDKTRVKQIMKNIRTCINVIPPVIEKQSETILGELGLDLGIDTSGRVWVIEVNAKPWKKTETEQGNPDLVERSFRKPMAFAKRLAFHVDTSKGSSNDQQS